ncbi:MAG: hypothetical protein V4699_01860 [Patescibacteria group bacterium]
MDQKELQEKIALYYSKLPPKAQEAFSSMTWLETLKTISQKYGLDNGQIETLGTETTLVLLGIVDLVEYEEVLTNGLSLSRDSADKIFMEIEEAILKNIRPQLVEAFEKNKNSEMGEGSEIEQKFDERFKKLPAETQKIITELNYQATLYSIAKEHNLNVEQIGILERDVTDLVVGAIHPDELENAIEKDIQLPLEKTKKLVDDINEKIFKKIREELIKNTERRKVFTKDTSTQTTNQTPEPQPKNNPTTPNKTSTEIVPEKLELIGEVHPLIAQKLSGSVQIPSTKTEHTLGNISKTNTTKIDPYREIPE